MLRYATLLFTMISPSQIWLGSKLSSFVGNATLPTPVNAAHLSHDPTVGKTFAADPLCREQIGSVKGVADMLVGGKALVEKDWKHWPKDLPVRMRQSESSRSRYGHRSSCEAVLVAPMISC
jgi:alpha-beta hydrolase superfamily lysophospholipase